MSGGKPVKEAESVDDAREDQSLLIDKFDHKRSSKTSESNRTDSPEAVFRNFEFQDESRSKLNQNQIETFQPSQSKKLTPKISVGVIEHTQSTNHPPCYSFTFDGPFNPPPTPPA
jgi:hypothetical protein